MTYNFPKAVIISESPSDMRFLCAFFEKEGYEVFIFNPLYSLDSIRLTDVCFFCVDAEIGATRFEAILQSIYSNAINTHMSLVLLNTSSNNLGLSRWLNDELLSFIRNAYSISVVAVQLTNRLSLQSESLFESSAFMHLCQSVGLALVSYDTHRDYFSDTKESFSYSSLSSLAVKPSLISSFNCVESEYFLDSNALKNVDPLPFLLNSVAIVSGLKKYSNQLFMIISELFSNALEHGVLGLNSELKNTPEGFSKYFSEKQMLLKTISSGFVSIKIRINYSDFGGVATVIVEDSGNGYNPDLIAIDANEEGVPYNRGLYLVRYFSEEVTVSPKGNKTTILFRWSE